ncbi:MAG: putative DCC family thiol-disulfide oxidoreductase YuxK [Rickettsiales bacterium]|jgi:predicted DCC family thiol-disulfide oxidoreductase YuxK
MIKVFYDGKCGLCRKEIEHYKRIAPENIFIWIDITKNSSQFKALGFSVSDGLRALHAQDSNQKIHIGVDAFIIIWRNIPLWRVLGFFANLPIIKPLIKIVYKLFANWRFKRLGYDKCDL